MSNDIYEFIRKKQKKLEENNSFKEWNKNNKIQDDDGFPIIAFHGSTQAMFTEVSEDFFEANSYMYGGFYMSSSISDVNENYARVGGDLDKVAGILSERSTTFDDFNTLIEEGVYLDDSFTDEEIKKIEYFYEEEDLRTVGEIKKAFPQFDFDHLKEMMGQFTNYDLNWDDDSAFLSGEDFGLTLLISKKYTTTGWVSPFVVKMENPCYTGFGEKDTLIRFNTYNSKEVKEEEISLSEDYPAFEEAIDAVKDIYEREGLSPTEFMENFEREASYECGTNQISTLYNIAKTILVDEFDYEEEEAEEITKKSFIDNASDYISFDEDGDVENDEELYIPDYGLINSANDRELSDEYGEKIMEFLSNHHSDIASVYSSLEGVFGESLNIEEVKEHLNEATYEDEERKVVFDAISSVFDGIVMNAYKANKENWNNSFDLAHDTVHYISFKPNNVKSAIGNNSFSLFDDDFVQRKTKRALKKDLDISMSAIENHLEYIKSTWSNMPNTRLVNSDSFDNKDVDAIYSRKTNKLYLNKDRMDSIETLEKTLLHETVVHYGLHKFFDEDLTKMLDKVSEKYADEIECVRIENYNHLDPVDDKLKLAEEFVAFHAEKVLPKDTFLKKVKNKMKRAYVKMKKTIGLKTTLEEDLFEMLSTSEEMVKGKKKNKRSKIKNKF